MRKILFTIVSVISLFALASCAKGDGDKEYGVEKVYIPQSMADGGITNIYNVPSGEGEYTYNFSIEEETVEVFLGVIRSGKQTGEAFSVDIIVNDESTAKQAAALGAELFLSKNISISTSLDLGVKVGTGKVISQYDTEDRDVTNDQIDALTEFQEKFFEHMIIR